MCVPLGGRRGRPGRQPKYKPYPEYWMNDKRVEKEDGIYSLDGKTLVKLAPSVDGEYTIPETVTKVLVGAFTECHCSKVIFHPGIKNRVTESMFNDHWGLTIIDQQGEPIKWNSAKLFL